MRKGFTLIELLVVVALIGILATLVMANFTAARSRSRDAQRKSDLRQISTALRLYYNDNGSFPVASGIPWGAQWTGTGGNVYMNVVPNDPLWDSTNPGTPSYLYELGSANDPTDTDYYRLSACLENKSDDKGYAALGNYAGWCPDTEWMYQVKP
jgi:prepilin-type N-terminal cleavage/methylation domain-containing protein